jgi:hypothetical protein
VRARPLWGLGWRARPPHGSDGQSRGRASGRDGRENGGVVEHHVKRPGVGHTRRTISRIRCPLNACVGGASNIGTLVEPVGIGVHAASLIAAITVRDALIHFRFWL